MGIDPEAPSNSDLIGEDILQKGGGGSSEGRRSPEKMQAACEEGFGSQEQREDDNGLLSALGGDVGSPPPFAATQYPILSMGSQTRLEATLNLLNNLLGAGLLAMPRAFAHTGIIFGILLMIAVAVANRYTLLMLLELRQSQLEDCSYPEMGRHVFGQKGLLAVLVAYLLFTGGILSAYLIAITDILQQLPVFNVMPRMVLVLTAVGICTPGALLKSLRKVAVVSGVCMLGVCTLVVVLTAVSVSDALTMELDVATDEEHPERPGIVHWFCADFGGLLDGACLFALQFSVQAGGIEVLSSIVSTGRARTGSAMQRPSCSTSDAEDEDERGQVEQGKNAPDLVSGDLVDTGAGQGPAAAAAVAAAVEATDGGAKPLSELMQAPLSSPTQSQSDGNEDRGSTTLQAAAEVSTLAFCIAGLFMVVIGVAGYLRFGDRVRGDVLLSFGARVGGDSSPALAISRFAYGLVVTCSFAFVMVPCRFAALDVFALRRRDHAAAAGDALPPETFKKVTIVILSICASIAWVVSDLALMLEFVGVWSTMALSFVLPCGFLLELKRRQEGQPILSTANALPLCLLAFGLFVAAVGTVQLLVTVFGGEVQAGEEVAASSG